MGIINILRPICKSLKLTSHGILHFLCQVIYQKAFLNLSQYLSFLDIFFQYMLPGRKVWGYPSMGLTLLVLS